MSFSNAGIPSGNLLRLSIRVDFLMSKEIKCSLNYAMTLTGNNKEERNRSQPFGDRTLVAGLQGIRTANSTIMPLPGTSSPKSALYSWGVTADHQELPS